MDWKAYESKKEELKREAQKLLDTAETEKRELDPHERDAYEQIRGQVKVLNDIVKEERAEAERILETATAEPAKTETSASDFFRNMQKGTDVELRAWASNSGSGSYMVPQEWHDSVESYRFQRNFLRQAGAMVVRTESTHNIPVLSALATAAVTAENAAYTASDPTIAQVILYAYKLSLKTVVSEELISDAAYDVGAELARANGLAFGAAEEGYFMTGTGSSQPTGIFNKAADKTLAANNAITKDELIESVYGLSRHYRDGAVWMMDDTTALYIAKLKLDVTTSGTTPYFWTDAVGGEPPRLLGYPVYTQSTIADITTSAKVIAFGNPAYYVIGERGPMQAKRLTLNEYGDTFAFAHRIDGKPLDASAFYVVGMKTS